ECLDKRLDHANWTILVDPIVQAFRKQRTLATVRPLDKALHPIPRKSRGNRIARAAPSGTFSHSQGQTEKSHAVTRRSANRQKADMFGTKRFVALWTQRRHSRYRGGALSPVVLVRCRDDVCFDATFNGTIFQIGS